jgi:dephospho-CoA kinase
VIVALVGLCGSGKSEAAKYFEGKNYKRIYFGSLTMEELERRGLSINEKNERAVREELRKTHGMAAYAILSLPKIEDAIKNGFNVFIDGLYSWSEYKILKDKYPDMAVIAIYTNPPLRLKRLSMRKVRPLTKEEASSRDTSEIENLEKGGPIAKADYTILNNGTIDELLLNMNRVLS